MRVLVLILILNASHAVANDDSGLIGSAGAYTRNTSQAAAANRRTADQLFQQSLADEKKALSTFPPNIGLLAKAGVMAMDGIKADQQAQHFAKAAMNGINTGSNAGDFKSENYGGLSQDQINQLATTNSSLRGQVQSHVEGWGLKVSPDGSKISLPLGMGSVSMSIGLGTIESGMKAAAKMLGYDPSDISNGIQQAVAMRDAIAKRAEADAMAMANASGGGSSAQGVPANLDASGQAAGEGIAEPASNNPVAANDSIAIDESVSHQVDILEQEAQLDKYRNQLKATMGIDDRPAMGRSDQDIFKMVHLRYQMERRQGSFIESGDQVLASGH